MCFVVLPGLVACSAEVVANEATRLTAVIEIDRTISDLSDPGHSSAIARFVRAGAGDDAALRLVSASSDLPAIGTCASGGAPSGSAQSFKREGPVELLDVGNVTIAQLSAAGTGVRSTLVARRLPDVVDLVSGVVYTARGPEDGSFGPGRYSLRVAGSADVPSFVREADAPATLSLVRVADQDANGTIVVDGASDVSWESGSERDVVVIEVTGSPSTMRCSFGDLGHATVPAGAFGAQGTLTLRRIHREPFAAAGVDRGEIRFEFARIVPYRHR